MRDAMIIFGLACSLAACGGDAGGSAPDESGDLGDDTSSGSERVASEIPRGLEGTRWRWLEAHCTEGPLDLSGRGYSAELVAHQDDQDVVMLELDEHFAAEGCDHTIVVRATPPDSSPDWRMREVARIAVPSTPECFGRPEDARPGTVRRAGQLLEVLVQRSQWCNGLEVRMVYAPVQEDVLGDDEIVRHYAAQFTLGNADAVASLFAETGALLEPFTRTETGAPYRHNGRAAVRDWYNETFETAPWRSMRITEVASGQTESGAASRVVDWEYMDPRLTDPLPGRTTFTIAAGEIFEALIELNGEPHLRPEAQEADAEEGSSD